MNEYLSLEKINYIKEAKNSSPEEILKYMGQARDFFLQNMTDDGRKYFLKKRYEGRDFWNGGKIVQ